MMNKTLAGRLFAHFDHLLLGLLCLVIVVALFLLYSASGQNMDQIWRQVINLSTALTLMWITANISPQRLESIAVPAYVLGMLLLIGVALFGEISHGARRCRRGPEGACRIEHLYAGH